MKTLKYLTMAVIAAFSLFITSCSDDDDNSNKTKPNIDDIIEDGFYITGNALPFDGIDVKGRMIATTNEADENALREGLYDIYITLEAGKSFNFAQVKGSTTTNYGPNGDYKITQELDENYNGNMLLGNFTEGGQFTVEQSALYHVAIDLETKRFAAIPVTQWCIIGAATDAGWSDNESINVLKASLNTQSMSFSKSGIVLKEGSFKFRHSAAWKQILSTDPNVNINTNFSGTVGDLSNNKIPFTNLLAGGSDATLTKDHRGIYTVSVIWTLGQENFTVSIERTGDAVIADYPSELWLRGDGVTGDDSGWEAVNSIKFKAVPDVPSKFWTIAYLYKDKGFKMDPTNEWNGDFGASGDAAQLEGFSGVEYAKGTANIPVPGETGYYIISIDLEAEKIAVTSDINIYLTGADQTGEWGIAMPEYKFTLVGDEFISPETKAGDLRMFVDAPYIADWWGREFHVFDGKIVYREADEIKPPLSIAAGLNVYLNFKTGEGTVK